MAGTLANLIVKIGADQKALTQGLGKAKSGVKSFETGVKKTSVVSRKATREMGQGFADVGNTINTKTIVAIAALTAAIGLAARETLNVGRSFSQAIGQLSAVTGQTGDQLEFLSDKAKEFGQTTTQTAVQVAQAFTLIGSKRSELLKTPAALAAVTKEAIALAEATNIAVPEAAEALGNTLNQLNLDADQSSRVINAFAATVQEGAVNVNFLTEALVKAGPIARKFNIPLEDTLAVLNSLGKAGLQASVAGTGFASTLLKLAKDGRSQFNPEANTLIKLLDNIGKAELKTTEALELFGLETFNVAGLMVDFNGTSKEMIEKITGTSTAYEQASIQAATYDGKLKTLSSALEGLQLEIFSKVEPSLVAMVERFTDLSRKAIELVEPVSGVLAVIGKSGLVLALTLASSGMISLAAKLAITTGAFLATNVAALTLQTTLTSLLAAGFIGFTIGQFLESEFKIARDAGALFFNFVGKNVAQLVFVFKSLGAFIGTAFTQGFDVALAAIGGALSVLASSLDAFGFDELAGKAFKATGQLARFREANQPGSVGTAIEGFRQERDVRFANIDEATITSLRRDTDTPNVNVTVELASTEVKKLIDTAFDGLIDLNTGKRTPLNEIGIRPFGDSGIRREQITITVVTNLDGQKVAESVVRTDNFKSAVADTRETLTRSVAR